MRAVPFVAVAGTHAGQIGPRALGTPLERTVIDELAGDRIVAIAFRFRAQRTHHLRVAVVAAFAHVNVAARQAQRRIRLQAGDRFRRALLEEQGDDLDGAADADHHRDQGDQQPGVSLNPCM
ncbi:hypothetical protein D3C72_2140650 [compost metagenome]